MSSPHRHRPPLEVTGRGTCMCTTGDACSSFAPGHALHLIQARLAAATPSGWNDALVESVDPVSGEIAVRSILSGDLALVWTAAAADLGVGEPVALHERYGVLAAGPRRLNVARLG